MIIDNSELDRFIASKAIMNACFAKEVTEMSSGSLALAYLRNADNDLPELIFLDINMPNMSGFEFLEHYDALPEHIKSRPIIMLSSSLYPGDIANANANPYIVRYMTKPLTRRDLEAITAES